MPSKLRQMGLARAGDIYKVNPRILEDCPYGNVRSAYDPEALQELADSIKAHGVEQPIVIYTEGDHIFVVDGHRRKYASLLAIEQGCDIETIPATLQPREERSELDILTRQLTANQSVQLPPMDEAHGFYRYIKHGWTQQRIATTLGYKQAYVSNRLALLRAEEPLQNAVVNGIATPSDVVAAVRTAEREEIPQAQALAVVTKQKALTRAAVKAVIQAPLEDADAAYAALLAILYKYDLDTALAAMYEVFGKQDVAALVDNN